MTERRNTLMEPRVEDLLESVESKFTLVTLAARRAREINDYYAQLGHGVGRVVPPQITSVSSKPLSIALEEIDEGKITARRLTDEEMSGLDQDEAQAARAALEVSDDADSAEASDDADADAHSDADSGADDSDNSDNEAG